MPAKKNTSLPIDSEMLAIESGETVHVVNTFSHAVSATPASAAQPEKSNGDIILDNVGPNEEITTETGSVTVKGHIGEGAIISARDGITAYSVSKHVKLFSSSGGVRLNTIDDNVVIGVHGDVIINGGTWYCSDCDISSSTGKVSMVAVGSNNTIVGEYGVTIEGGVFIGNTIKAATGVVKTSNVGHNNTLEGRDGVYTEDLGEGNRVTSSDSSITAKTVGPSSILNGRDGISVQAVCENAQLISSCGKIDAQTVKAKAVLKARDRVSVRGSVDSSARLTASYGNVIIAGQPQKALSSTSTTSSQTRNATKPVAFFGSALAMGHVSTAFNFTGSQPDTSMATIKQ